MKLKIPIENKLKKNYKVQFIINLILIEEIKKTKLKKKEL
jgi:hypothetical protein